MHCAGREGGEVGGRWEARWLGQAHGSRRGGAPAAPLFWMHGKPPQVYAYVNEVGAVEVIELHVPVLPHGHAQAAVPAGCQVRDGAGAPVRQSGLVQGNVCMGRDGSTGLGGIGLSFPPLPGCGGGRHAGRCEASAGWEATGAPASLTACKGVKVAQKYCFLHCTVDTANPNYVNAFVPRFETTQRGGQTSPSIARTLSWSHVSRIDPGNTHHAQGGSTDHAPSPDEHGLARLQALPWAMYSPSAHSNSILRDILRGHLRSSPGALQQQGLY